jgi:hypothetical protein
MTNMPMAVDEVELSRSAQAFIGADGSSAMLD